MGVASIRLLRHILWNTTLIPKLLPANKQPNLSIYCLPVKYHHVGKLLKDGEEPTEYTDEEDTKDSSDQKKKN